MNTLKIYSNQFFDELEVFEDLSRGHSYKAYLRQAVLEFLENETKETAFAVYQTFFDSYRITLPGESNPFIDLLDVLRSYEENAATLIDKQRDHYIHSVNVFILGLCIYSQNSSFRAAFNDANMDKEEYPYSYDTPHEEFFYRWGIASLFHDVGYPVEIIGKQISKFVGFATEVDDDVKVKSHLEFDNFEELNSINEVIPKREFVQAYYEKYDSCVYVDLLAPIDLLAHKCHLALGVDLKKVKTSLDGFVDFMAKNGFIDHGFFSAIIVLKWYGFLIQSCRYKPEYFFYPVLDSASAILLHNYYKNVIMKPPFEKGRLAPGDHPIAYLLILCDEMQEWNRTAYGIVDKKRTQAGEASITITESRMDVTYITRQGTLPEQFAAEKEATFNKLLDLRAIFDEGFFIGCESMSARASLASVRKMDNQIASRPLLDNLEKIAMAIHDSYNQKQQERHPNQALSYPQFSDLPDTLKYSNLRQARSIVGKVDFMGWEMRTLGSQGKVIASIPDDLVETLAEMEHDEWMQERTRSGWNLGAVKDTQKKITPYLVPYDELSEEIKEYDRDTVRNIPELLGMVGLAAFAREEISPA
jgi:hypothetical protein